MNKTTTTMLMAAGLVVLAGCKTEVMQDRHFQGDPPQEDPVITQKVPESRAPETKGPTARKKTPVSTYLPMEESYGNEGIENAPARRRVKRAKAASGAVAKGGVYIVKPGDTLGRIAYRHRVSVKALRSANNRTPAQDRFLRPGTKLVIPGGKGAVAAPAGKKGKAPVARRGVRNAAKLNADGTYTMVRGDNIPKVARKFGIRAKALQRANNLTDEETTKLQIGHKLVIPTGDDAKASVRKKAPRKVVRKAEPVKKDPVPSQQDPLPPPPAANENSGVTPPPPAADTTTPPAPAARETTTVLPPPAPVATDSNTGTDYVSTAGCNTLEEFAAKYNTTVAEVLRLNPRIDSNTPIASAGMLFVPRSAAK